MASLGTLTILPRETRDQIFQHVLAGQYWSYWHRPRSMCYFPCCDRDAPQPFELHSNESRCSNLNLLLVSREIYMESSTMMYLHSTFTITLASNNDEGYMIRPALSRDVCSKLQYVQIRIMLSNQLNQGIFLMPEECEDSKYVDARTILKMFGAPCPTRRKMEISFMHNQEVMVKINEDGRYSTEQDFIDIAKNFVAYDKVIIRFQTLRIPRTFKHFHKDNDDFDESWGVISTEDMFDNEFQKLGEALQDSLGPFDLQQMSGAPVMIYERQLVLHPQARLIRSAKPSGEH